MTVDELRRLRDDAKAMLHELMLGRRVRVMVDQSGERVEFDRASIGDLRSYIDELEAQIAEATGTARTGPLYVIL